jgi:CBS domain-containing protein
MPNTTTPTDHLVRFLGTTLPFSELSREVRLKLARQADIDFIPAGVRFIDQGVSRVDHLFVIQSGAVRSVLTGEDGQKTLIDLQGPGASFGSLAIIRGSLANFSVETVEDSFFLRIPARVFADLAATSPVVAHYYLKTMSETYVSKAFNKLRQIRGETPSGTGSSLFAARIRDMVHRELISVDAALPVREVATLMGRHNIGSVAVIRNRTVAGIVTDKDFRSRIVAEGGSRDAPIETIMSSPIQAVSPDTMAFDGLLHMMRRGIHHLGILAPDGKNVTGMVTSHDFMLLQGHSPLSLIREIRQEPGLDGVCTLSKKIPALVRTMFEEGARASRMGRLVSLINDAILDRVVSRVEEELGPAPARYCWLILGSEGRREQTLRTDQDNGLVYSEPEPGREKTCKEYFEEFGRRVTEQLIRCGYPPCPGQVMASNPDWNGSLTKWATHFEHWIGSPAPHQVLHMGIAFDFRGGAGDTSLADELRHLVLERISGDDIFLRHMAADWLRHSPPLTLFKGFVVEKDGEHRNTLDIKSRGVMPLTEFARLLALIRRLPETGTQDRFRLAAERGLISASLHTDLRESCEFLMQVRLAHQLERLEQDRIPDNRINPARLGDLERKTLKEALGVMTRVQAWIRERFQLQ